MTTPFRPSTTPSGAAAVTVSVLVESTLLAIVGALAGALLAWTFVDGNTFAATQYLGPGARVNLSRMRGRLLSV